MTHLYVSTGCQHGEHGYCAGPERADGGDKLPATCKFCQASCLCPCHAAPVKVKITDEMIGMFEARGTGGYGDVTDIRAGLKAALGVAGFEVES